MENKTDNTIFCRRIKFLLFLENIDQNTPIYGEGQREMILLLYGKLIQLTLVLCYLIEQNYFIKSHLSQSFIVPLNTQSKDLLPFDLDD